MPELHQVLGAILRDVAHARVISDAFSRNVSVDYDRDDLLRHFPVPRLEIRQATIDLRFAVSSVTQRETDRQAVIRAHLGPGANDLAVRVYSEMIGTDPRRAELEEAMHQKGVTLEPRLRLAADAIERMMSENIEAVEAAIAGDPDALSERLVAGATDALLEDGDVRDFVTRGMTVGAVREHVASASAAALERLTEEHAGEDLESVPDALVADIAAELAARVYRNIVLAHPRRERVLEAARESGVALEGALREAAESALRENRDQVRDALEGRQRPLRDLLQEQLSAPLLDDSRIRSAITRRASLRQVRENVGAIVHPAAVTLAKGLAAALAAEAKQTLSVDVAVTSDELAEVPEAMVSQLSVVSDIRNYSWVAVEEQGVVERRLRPE